MQPSMRVSFLQSCVVVIYCLCLFVCRFDSVTEIEEQLFEDTNMKSLSYCVVVFFFLAKAWNRKGNATKGRKL